ncbi:MAG: hypothetical protein J2P41_22415, partial [Blastocatellia bacterium]|nr:hypothetical protein [Blastocatellia bacterium]
MKAKIRRAALLVALISLVTSVTTGQSGPGDKQNRQPSPRRQQDRIVAKDTTHDPQDFTGISESDPREFNRRFFSKE